MRFSAWNSFHLLRNLLLNSYMPCSVHFVKKRLLTSDILRLAISILFAQVVAVESPLKRQSFLELKIIRSITWNCNFLNMKLRKPIYTPTISLKPIKDMQQHTVFPSCAKYLYHRAGMSRLRDTEQEVQCTSNRKLTEQYK